MAPTIVDAGGRQVLSKTGECPQQDLKNSIERPTQEKKKRERVKNKNHFNIIISYFLEFYLKIFIFQNLILRTYHLLF